MPYTVLLLVVKYLEALFNCVRATFGYIRSFLLALPYILLYSYFTDNLLCKRGLSVDVQQRSVKAASPIKSSNISAVLNIKMISASPKSPVKILPIVNTKVRLVQKSLTTALSPVNDENLLRLFSHSDTLLQVKTTQTTIQNICLMFVYLISLLIISMYVT